MDPTYNNWVFHGEPLEISPPVENTSTIFRMNRDANFANECNVEDDVQVRNEEISQNIEDIETPLYEGCSKYTKLSAIVALYKHKATYGLSDKGFDELLSLLRDMLPPNNVLPESLYSTKKLLQVFDLGYEKIHACVNDCCLFRKELENHEECPKCGTSRWKVNKVTKRVHKGTPAKVLRYFPIIRRFRRMFTSVEMANELRWHSTHTSQDQKMRHPVDSESWKTINKKWPSFASEPRNLRLGLAADGFNPFSNLSTSYSCWPVVLVTYNLPPWKCMENENLMLTLLIPGKKQPGNDIDVYLQPLIEDLSKLWHLGVEVFDSSTKSTFNLKAILMWTINDFPAYGNLAGCCVKGKYVCPICGFDIYSQRLKYSGKHVYMGHRRFLPKDHVFRKKKSWFNGKEDMDDPPKFLDGKQVRIASAEVENDWGKRVGEKRKRKCHPIWKKRSIFFELPYWEELCLRHNLDVMHIEKNICESLVGTLLDIPGKSKDGINSRRDLQEMGIRHDLHVKEDGNKLFLPAAPHTLSKMSIEGISTNPSSSGSDGGKKRKARGANQINYSKIEKAKTSGIQYNELGQPYGDASVIYSSAYGALVAQNIPITYESWLKVPNILKDTLWERTKIQFGVDDNVKDQTVKQMGICWRALKTRITKKIRNVASGPNAQRELQNLKPSNISDDDWNNFLHYRLSPEFQEISQKYSNKAKLNTTPHTTSRRGMARLRAQLRAAKLAEGKDSDEVDRADVWIAGHTCRDGTAVTEDAAEKITQYSSDSNPVGDKAVNLGESSQQPLSRGHTSRCEEAGGNGISCHLLDWRSGQVVAEAEIDSKDPLATIHHEMFGPDCWRVCVKNVIISIPL